MRNKILNFALKIALLQFCYLLFFQLFYFFNLNTFSGIGIAEYLYLMLASTRFNFSAIAFTNVLYTILFFFPFNVNFKWKPKGIKILFIGVNAIAFALNTIDLVYFKFNGKRTGSEIFITQGIGKDIIRLLPQFAADYWYVILIFAGIIWMFVKCTNAIDKKYVTNSINNKTLTFALWLLSLGLSILAFRGGTQLRPIKPITAGLYAEPQFIPMVLNTPFCIIRTAESTSLEIKSYFKSNSELIKEYNPIKQFNTNGITKNTNVFIIILESFSNEYIGYFNKDYSYTPFLDSLFKQSHFYIHGYANGKRSIEGIPAILAGMPSLSETPYISSNYSSNKIDAMGTLLKKEGYHTSFFHGGHNGTMGFDYFAKLAGFDNYYGLNEYSGNKKNLDGNWGVFDEPFLKFTVDKINEFKEPFVTSVFTLSSHHPFLLPSDYQYTGPKTVKHPILKTIKYTDDALKAFFNYASKQKWFNNTLFVITADHTGPDYTPKGGTIAGLYQIPIAYYMPGKIKPYVDKRVSQQIDILPTVLDYLGYKNKFYAFGNAMRDTARNGFAINYSNNTHQYFTDSLLYQFYNEKSICLFKPYSDTLLAKNWKDELFYLTKLYEQKTKAIIQTYNNDLIKNKTHADN